MIKVERLTSLATKLSDEQIDDLLEVVDRLVAPVSVYDTLPEAARAGIADGLAQLDRGEGIALADYDRHIRAKLAAARA